MTKEFREHLKECEQKESRITELVGTITTNKQALIQLKEDYEKAVINDLENIDDLFHEMEALEKKIKADQHKLKTLKKVTEDFLRESAFNVLLKFPNVIRPFEKEFDKINDKYKAELKRHDEVVQKLKGQVRDVNERYEDKAYSFLELTEKHGITGKFKGENPYPVGVRKDLDEAESKAREKAAAEHKLLSPQLYNRIEEVAEGRRTLFSLKGVN